VTWIFHVTVTEEFDMAVSYKALTGIDYPPNKRVEIGAVVSDLPPQSIKWLLDSGAIEDTSNPTKSVKEESVLAPIVQEPVIVATLDAKETDEVK
jgi:hypothetical protein